MSKNERRTCSICVKIFSNKVEHQEHQNREHNANKKERKSTCTICSKTFLHKNYLQSHIAVVHTRNPSEGQCGQCEKAFINRHQLAIHKQQQHRDKKSSCDQCHLKFRNDGDKNKHIERTHLKLKNVSCDKCSYQGFSIDHLRIHIINKHSNFKPYKCELCPMAFPRIGGLYNHSETHENSLKTSKDNPCQICGKMFKSGQGSERCAKKHKLEGNFECPIDNCDEKFNNMGKLKRHQQKAHSGDNPPKHKIYPCHNCDKSFKTRADLKRHVTFVHEKPEKNITCLLCPQMFNSDRHLKRHSLTHSNTILKCPHEGCEVTRRVQYSLNSHYKQMHGQVSVRKTLDERMAQQMERNKKIACKVCNKLIKKGKGKEKSMNAHMKNHKNQVQIACIVEGCPDQIYFSQSINNHAYNLPIQFYEHLDLEHKVNMITHTVCVEFKCKHCDEDLNMKCLNPQVSKQFVSANAKK